MPPTTPPVARIVPDPTSPTLLRLPARERRPHAGPEWRTPSLSTSHILLAYGAHQRLAYQPRNLPHHIGDRAEALVQQRCSTEI
jgi:hypothetical protein